jgi:hypothetical protein
MSLSLSRRFTSRIGHNLEDTVFGELFLHFFLDLVTLFRLLHERVVLLREWDVHKGGNLIIIKVIQINLNIKVGYSNYYNAVSGNFTNNSM